MPITGPIKPTHKALQNYYAALRAYSDQQVTHEGAVETAFQRLLDETAKTHGWSLVPKLTVKRGGKSLIPDGTVRDEFNLHRGYWEAKDTDDDLSAEIQKKAAKGYPLVNTIFEDTRRAVLFQNGVATLDIDLTDPQAVSDLLNAFYAFTEPDIEGFEQAVSEFKERVPELAMSLVGIIKQAHQDNAKFIEAFDSFFSLCQNSLNPNISIAAVDEMLVQHLLTERLIRRIFDNPEFTQRNVIAAEVERVIAALVSKSFNREGFLKSLDRFYRAIETTAHSMEDFSEKQDFLNTVYERFFQGYSVAVADTHGIVYTPQEIVDFMCASVAELLESEFGKTLGDPDVHILDPCTGTGNFVVNLLRRIPKKHLSRMYRKQLFANEVMLLPYYIAALNIEHAYFELAGEYEPFEGLCFVDTLDLAEKRQLTLFGEENTARVVRQKNAPITVIIGNPPYNANQVSENDNNKNRKYPVIDGRIQQTFAKDTSATLKNKLYDPYVKFFRWAMDRLNGRDGIVCFVSNNSFIVDGAPFDGIRKHLERDFSLIEHVDLHGNVRQNPKLSGTTHNVFGIQVGVGITIAVRKSARKKHAVLYHRVPENWRKDAKLAWLAKVQQASRASLKKLKPDADDHWIVLKTASEFKDFLPMGGDLAERLFEVHSTGAKSNRDDIVYDFNRKRLVERVETFIDDFNAEVDRYKRKYKGGSLDDFVDYSRVRWSSTLKLRLGRGKHASFSAARVRTSLYRPFTAKHLYYDDILNDRPGLFRTVFPTPAHEGGDNAAICCTNHSQMSFNVIVTNRIANEAVGGRAGTCFPLYVYSKDGRNRHENITDWALTQFRKHYKKTKLSKRDIFDYVYGILHHPGYRAKFADNLKRELPRIPFAKDFDAFVKAGQKLAALHLNYEDADKWPLKEIETPGVPLSYRVEKMKLSKDKSAVIVNPSLTLAGIPPETFEYRLGNRSALEWVIDQYQVTEDKRSGICSDPNREDDPEYIVRLVGQVIHVSVETVRIVKSLPKLYEADKKT